MVPFSDQQPALHVTLKKIKIKDNFFMTALPRNICSTTSIYIIIMRLEEAKYKILTRQDETNRRALVINVTIKNTITFQILESNKNFHKIFIIKHKTASVNVKLYLLKTNFPHNPFAGNNS